MSRPIRPRAIAAMLVAIAAIGARVLGCSSTACDMTGVCCCAGGQSGTAFCGAQGPACLDGFALYRGSDCQTKCGGDAATGAGDASDAPADADAGCDTSNVCCCQGDVLDFPMCVQGGQITCAAGYGLYRGDDCRCLPDRNTPCCLPHPLADAGGDG